MFKYDVGIDRAISYRRHIHENPELSFKEFNTAKYIYDNLSKLNGLTVEMLTNNSVLAVLRGKAGAGKTIAFRADIDALPLQELLDVPFKSKCNGVMHACGHDVHAAILMRTVEIASQLSDQIRGEIRFIFQPAEEVPPGGAAELVKLGVMDGVDYVFGMHVFPNSPTGSIATMSGACSASQDIFDIIIKGKGSHGSTPELSIDPITIGCEVVGNINNIVSRNISALENAVISFGQFTSGEVYNVIPHVAHLKGTVRTFNPVVREFIEKRVREVVEHIIKAYNCDYELDYIHGYDSVINDPEAVDLARSAALQVLPKDMVLDMRKMMGSEDFSAYTKVTKGAFVSLGGGIAKDGYGYMNHHPMFNVDENAMISGIKYNMQLIYNITAS